MTDDQRKMVYKRSESSSCCGEGFGNVFRFASAKVWTTTFGSVNSLLLIRTVLATRDKAMDFLDHQTNAS